MVPQRDLNPELLIKVQASNPSTNNDMLKLQTVVLHLEKVLGSTPSIEKLSWCCFLLFDT